jgi:putative ABC transport system permease protein
MPKAKFLFQRLLAIWRPERVHDEIAEEFSFHIEQRTQENIRRGMAPDEARREAEHRFGHLTQIREQGYEVRGGGWVESFLKDVLYGIRVLRRKRAFTITAVITLALGIGVNAGLFAILESVLIRPLPYQQPEQLFMVRENIEVGSTSNRLSGPDFDDIYAQSHSFQRVAEVLAYFSETLVGEGEPRNVKCTGISYDFFPLLGVKPILGRLYTPQEYHIDGSGAVLAYRFWKQQFSGDPHVIGRVIKLGGGEVPILGVMPDMPDFLPETDIWLNNVPELEFMHWRQNKFLSVVGRLKPGVSRQVAEQELTAILRRAPGQPNVVVTLEPLKDVVVGNVSVQLKIAMGAVLVVLLITCVNMMGLLLARASERSGEVSMRLSLGASPARILRQFVTENLVLVSIGTVLGLGLAAMLLRVVREFNFGNLPRVSRIDIDARVFLLALLVTLVLSVVFAWGPVTLFSRLKVNGAPKMGRTVARRPRAFRALVVSEMGCALVLLVAAGLLLRSLWLVEHVDPGFAGEHVLTTYLRTNYYAAEGGSFYDELLERIAHTPGVENVAVADCVPGRGAAAAQIKFDDRANDPARPVLADGCWASADFFKTMGARLDRGRLFNAHDDAKAPAVVIVNQTFAREHWPGQDPIGKRIAVGYTGPGRRNTGAERLRQVVGVVADMRLHALDVPLKPALYMPFKQDETYHDFASMSLFVRTSGNPVGFADTLRRTIHAVRPDQTLGIIATMDDVLSTGFSQRRFSLGLLGSFAALALLLAAVGLYGTIAFSVSQRTREMGVRVALGATPENLLTMIVREGLVLAVAGIALGICLSLLCTRAISSMLFKVSAYDPLTFAAVAMVLVAVAATASFLPARKAAAADPMEALRAE